MKQWDDLPFWSSGEWQAAQERMDELKRLKISFNPARQHIFRALDECSFESVRVVILAQDPYPAARYAEGLAFSVPETIPANDYPPSLENIFKEYMHDLHYDRPKSGSLLSWAQRGCLLWNAYPTCQTGKPGSHRNWGEWSLLTHQLLSALSSERSGIVFLLWGNDAQSYRGVIDEKKHRVHSCSHPAPLGVNKGKVPFNKSRPFSTANALLCEMGKEPMDWKLP